MDINLEVLTKIAVNIRRSVIEEIYSAGSGHPGGSLDLAEIMAYLYFKEMNIDPKNPNMKNRDKLVLSKGHAAPVLYAALAEKGYFPKSELKTLRKTGSFLQGHPDMRKIPGVEMSTGSLGQGFSASCGMALAEKLNKGTGRIYVILGDGELQEGIVWETAMACSHYTLDNIAALVDHNGLQIDGENDKVMKVMPIADKFESFGWNVIEIDGHDFEDIERGYKQAEKCKGKPTCIIAKTIKGKGVSFMENDASWHGKAPNKEQAEKAMTELGGEL